MKADLKYILGIVISFLLLFCSAYGIKHYLETSSDKILTEIVQVEEKLLNNDFKSAEKIAEDIEVKWQGVELKWSFLVNHHEIDHVTTYLRNTIEYIKFQDLSNSMTNLQSLKYYIKHIPQLEDVNFKNIL